MADASRPSTRDGLQTPLSPPLDDQSRWLKKKRGSAIKFTWQRKRIFLAHYAQTSRMAESAAAAGVCYLSVTSHLKNDLDFAAAYEAAKAEYKDRVHRRAQEFWEEGTLEPILGGRFKDEIVAYKTTYATHLLAMEMRRVDPGYRDRTEIDVNVKSGVLLVPAPVSVEQWLELFARPTPASGEGGEEVAPGQTLMPRGE